MHGRKENEREEEEALAQEEKNLGWIQLEETKLFIIWPVGMVERIMNWMAWGVGGGG